MIGALVLFAFAGPVAAEEAQAERRPDVAGLGIEEIVITAEGRQQLVQDVPVSVTAITARQREDIGIVTIQDIADFTPGFTYGPGDRPSIRGIGRLSNNLSVENAVATYADGAWTNSVAEAGKSAIFVERTEILRGPQGTLYGRNAIGGAINVISKRPSEVFEAEARLTLYNENGSTIEGSVSGPITDSVRYRFAASQPKNDGFEHNVANGDQIGSLDLWYGEGQIEWDITEDLQLWAVYRTGKWEDDLLFNDYSPAPYVTSVNFESLAPSATFGFSQPGYTQLGVNTTQPGVYDPRERNENTKGQRTLDNVDIVGLHLDWTQASFGVHYIFGAQQYDYRQITDADFSPVTSYSQPLGQYFVPLPGEVAVTVFPSFVLDYVQNEKWYSHELSFKSEGAGAVQWIAGLYYFHDEFDQPVSINLPGQAQLATPTFNFFCDFANSPDCLGGAPFFFPWDPSPQPAPANPSRSIYSPAQSGDNDAYAGYGQIDWDVTDHWQVTLGLRRTKDEKNVDESIRIVCFGNFRIGCSPVNDVPLVGYVSQANDLTTIAYPNIGVTDPITGRRSRELHDDWQQTTGTAGIQFRPNDDALWYLRYSRGYKAGGFNAGTLLEFPATHEETIDAFELGWKQTFGDQFQIFSSAFYYDWHDMQVPLTVELPNGLPRNDLVNLKKVEIYGAEFETQWQPIDDLFLMTSYAYLHTDIKDGCCFLNPLNLEFEDLQGNALPTSPEHRVTFNASYNINFATGTAILSGTYIWRDDIYNDVFDNPEAQAPSWNQIDLRALWRDASDRYTLIAFVRNLNDSEIYTAAGAYRVATGGTPPTRIDQVFWLGAWRTYGIEVHYRFRAGT